MIIQNQSNLNQNNLNKDNPKFYIMLSKKIFLLFLTLTLLTGCGALPSLGEVLPDNRTKYQRSQSLPDLEVPPDLTTEALNDPLVIPDEEDANTLSEFQRRKQMRLGGQMSDAEMAMLNNTDEKWLSVQGTTFSIWPELREFWLTRGFEMDLDDAELGVLETQFREIEVDGVVANREKFKIFSEEGGTPGNLILFLSSERQELIILSDGNSEWIGQESNPEDVTFLISELNVHFYGQSTAASSSSSGSGQAVIPVAPVIKAEISSAGEGKEYLTIADEFSKAWRNIENAISESGMYIEDKDIENGMYFVIYYAAPDEEKKSLLSKLKFWGDDDEDGKVFHISLTGVGDKTEVVVLDEEDQWLESLDASRILSLLQSQYNRLSR
jgi:outer membrane protein assembly factor BamC